MPHFLNKPINSDFIFIVDCSGSMSGSRIQNASECLSIFLHSLPIGCNFNIIMFGSNYRSVFGYGGLVEYNGANKLSLLMRKAKSVKYFSLLMVKYMTQNPFSNWLIKTEQKVESFLSVLVKMPIETS